MSETTDADVESLRLPSLVCGRWLGLRMVASGREVGPCLPTSAKWVVRRVPTSGGYGRRISFLPLFCAPQGHQTPPVSLSAAVAL